MKSSGFTLIELLIYMALFGILMTGIISSFIQIGQSAAYIESQSILADESLFISGKLRHALVESINISSPLSGESSESLVLLTNGGTTIFETSSQVLTRSIDSVSRAVSGNTVSIISLIFTLTEEQPDYPKHLLISYTLEIRTQSGRVLRKDYGETIYDLPK